MKEKMPLLGNKGETGPKPNDLLVWMIEHNVPLHEWREYASGEKDRLHYSGWRMKKPDLIAREIVNSCSSSDAVELIAKE